jgi:hypothetical protein
MVDPCRSQMDLNRSINRGIWLEAIPGHPIDALLVFVDPMFILLSLTTTPTSSSVLVAVSSVMSRLIVLKIVLNTALVCCFVNGWTILIVSSLFNRGLLCCLIV